VAHIPVTSISGVYSTIEAGVSYILGGSMAGIPRITVNPSNATNNVISWSVVNAGTTGATIDSGFLSTTAAGAVTIRATIINGATSNTNYIENFHITVTAAHTPVTSITGVPTTAIVGIPLTLMGTVNPSDATNRMIDWSIVNTGGTGAYMGSDSAIEVTPWGSRGNNLSLNTTAAGILTVRAIIFNGVAVGENYTQDFNIIVNSNDPTSITLNTSSVVLAAGQSTTLFANILPIGAKNDFITWESNRPNFVSVDNSGVITAHKVLSHNDILNAGWDITITATTRNGLSVSCKIHVSQEILHAITL
jgi:endo-1,4-beta-xylanase